jgi:hypothetical protein
MLPQNVKLQTWGASLQIASWAIQKQIPYHIPSMETVKKIHSKVFSFKNAPKLKRSRLIESKDEALSYIKSEKFPIVLKDPFGAAGRGIHVLQSKKEALGYIQNHSHYPVICEPFVDRILDFSSQWIIKPDNIRFLGYCRSIHSRYGNYQGTIVGDTKAIFQGFEEFLKMHKIQAMKLLQTIQKLGYFGHLGIDAMVYKKKDQLHLQPIVEINARKTMGYVTLKLRELHFENERVVKLQLLKTEDHHFLLPKDLQIGEKTQRFGKNLVLNFDL